MLHKCQHCKQPETGYRWCRSCMSKKYQDNFDKWTSGNEYIDKFIQETQLNARNEYEIMEWIPYERLINVEYLTQGGFSTIYKAIWLDGRIDHSEYVFRVWYKEFNFLYNNKNDHKLAKEKDNESPFDENENRGLNVVVKGLDNSSNINDDFLNEWKNQLKCMIKKVRSVIRIYGITKNPETSDYMIIMKLMYGGDLRSNLLMKKYNPFEKYGNLKNIAKTLSILHKGNLVHGDLHSGNILLNTFDGNYISDFGLSRPAANKDSDGIYGIIPYIAPEVLRGKPYTKAADIYSFGIIMWEFTSGTPAFNNRSHDFKLALDICRGLRPKIVKSILPVYTRLMKRCWDPDPDERPTVDELVEIFSVWHDYYPKYDRWNRIPVPDNEKIPENHPQSCYASRRLDYSAKLNEDLTHELIVIDEFNDETTSFISDESSDDCMVKD